MLAGVGVSRVQTVRLRDERGGNTASRDYEAVVHFVYEDEQPPDELLPHLQAEVTLLPSGEVLAVKACNDAQISSHGAQRTADGVASGQSYVLAGRFPSLGSASLVRSTSTDELLRQLDSGQSRLRSMIPRLSETEEEAEAAATSIRPPPALPALRSNASGDTPAKRFVPPPTSGGPSPTIQVLANRRHLLSRPGSPRPLETVVTSSAAAAAVGGAAGVGASPYKGLTSPLGTRTPSRRRVGDAGVSYPHLHARPGGAAEGAMMELHPATAEHLAEFRRKLESIVKGAVQTMQRQMDELAESYLELLRDPNVYARYMSAPLSSAASNSGSQDESEASPLVGAAEAERALFEAASQVQRRTNRSASVNSAAPSPSQQQHQHGTGGSISQQQQVQAQPAQQQRKEEK